LRDYFERIVFEEYLKMIVFGEYLEGLGVLFIYSIGHV